MTTPNEESSLLYSTVISEETKEEEIASGLLENDKMAEAEEYLTKALELDKFKDHDRRGALYFMRGNSRMFLRKNDEAIQDYDEALTLLPDVPKNDRIYAFRGRCYYVKGIYDAAIEDFDKVLKDSKNSAIRYYVLYNKSYCLQRQKYLTESTEPSSCIIL